MAASLSIDAGEPKLLPSLPPSPTTSEDLSRAPAWADPEEEEEETTPRKKQDKGKERVVNLDVEEADASGEVSEEESPGSYPPISEDTTETRRIEENLRRWEQTERQRRKAARESLQPQPRSLVGDVTRRASLLWPRKANPSHTSRSVRSDDLGSHAALKSTEEVDFMPMESITDSPSISAHPSPHTSPRTATFGNPFNHPTDPVSPFDDTHSQKHPVVDGSATPSTPSDPPVEGKAAAHERPTLLESDSAIRNPPTPQPLGLPPPLTPPPPATSHPPGAIDPPSIAPHAAASPEPEQKPDRWWTDWLCGCSEGPDRGGDHQAGKTNPFE